MRSSGNHVQMLTYIIFQEMAKREPMYECLVEGCKKKFKGDFQVSFLFKPFPHRTHTHTCTNISWKAARRNLRVVFMFFFLLNHSRAEHARTHVRMYCGRLHQEM